VPVEPQVFDLLACPIRNRDHVVSKNDMLRMVWSGRLFSQFAPTNCINAARIAARDSGRPNASSALERNGRRRQSAARGLIRTPVCTENMIQC
jgi:DNA-binding winged helix-turn-helix (wHTH) protein